MLERRDKPMTEQLEDLGIKLYRGSEPEDRMVAVWWDSLCDTGELQQLVAENAYNLSAFFTLFKQPSAMIYTEKDGSIETAHWVEPVSTSNHAVFFSSWYTPELRGSKRQALLSHTIYSFIFSMGRKLIVGITKQPQLLKLHEKLGYVILGSMPNLFDGYEGWLMYLTPEGLASSRLAASVARIKEKAYAL